MTPARSAGLLLAYSCLAGGCAVQKTITITAKPDSAEIRVDGVARGTGTVTARLAFARPTDVHYVSAAKLGFKDRSVAITSDFLPKTLLLDLQQQSRRVSFTVEPVPAVVKVDGQPIGPDPTMNVSSELDFTVDADGTWKPHTVTAEREGFDPASATVNWSDPQAIYALRLKTKQKAVRVQSVPAGAKATLDGIPLAAPTTTAPAHSTSQIEFPYDTPNARYTPRVLRVEKAGYAPVEQPIAWDDGKTDYTIQLQPRRKTVRIVADPPEATVTIAGATTRPAGDGGVEADLVFDPIDEAGTLRSYSASVSRKNDDVEFVPATQPIAWDNGQTEYDVKLDEVLTRAVPLVEFEMRHTRTGWKAVAEASETIGMNKTDEPARGDGQTPPMTPRQPTPLIRLPAGQSIGSIGLSPDGRMMVYTVVTLAAADAAPGGAVPRADATGTSVQPGETAGAGESDAGGKKSATPDSDATGKIAELYATAAANGTDPLDALAALDAGPGADAPPPASQMFMIATDGKTPPVNLSDGKSLDVTPAFTSAGDQIVFSSNRAGRRLNIFSVAATGSGGVKRLTLGDTDDLWPSVDAEAKPRLFYEALVETRPDPRLYMTELSTIFQTDLTPRSGGTQPRVSPRGDALAFSAANARTSRRDVFRVPDRGGVEENLTNAPDSDDKDPAWNLNGGQIVFASDRETDPNQRRNYDLYVIDPNNPAKPRQLTANPSHDDRPVWDPSGEAVYFRSNRGGTWGIWRLPVK